MPSATFELFRDAIARKRQITCRYGGFVREVCPHVLGTGPDGRAHALVWQFAGGSSKPLPRGGMWRCFDLAKVSEVVVRDGRWVSDASYDLMEQTCVKRIVIASTPNGF